MKTQRIVISLIIGMLVGVVVGYKIAMKKVVLSRADYIRLSHQSIEHRARAYYVALASLNTNGVRPPSDLTSRALACFSNYVEEARMLSTLSNPGPIPINTNLFEEVLALLNTTNTVVITNM